MLTDEPNDIIENQPQPEPEPESEPPRDFEDLTLSEAVGYLVRSPVATLTALISVASSPTDEMLRKRSARQNDSQLQPRASTESAVLWAPSIPASEPAGQTGSKVNDDAFTVPEASPRVLPPPELVMAQNIPKSIRALRLAGRLAALGFALIGSSAMLNPPVHTEFGYMEHGLNQFFVAFVLWLLAESLPFVSRLVRGVRRDENNTNVPQFRADDLTLVPITAGRIVALTLAFIGSIYAYSGSAYNLFTPQAVAGWFGAIVGVVWAFAPVGWSPLSLLPNVRKVTGHISFRITLPLLALIAITVVGVYFRLYDMPGTPPEMTSDHVEKLLDVQRLRDGATNVFFANNGGRDALHFYFLAALSYIPGVEINFNLLKVASAIEGIITIPVIYWMAQQFIGKRDRKLGVIVGLLAAAFVAVSAWHVFMSRLGLRIVLTPLFTALAFGFLARGLRSNNRWDFIYAGLTLGFGLYGYQALRMLPIVVLLGVGISLLVGGRTMRVRATLIGNLTALVVVAAVIFVPLYRFSVDYPELFWNRTSGRVFGDELTQEMDENGNLVRRYPSVQEQVDALVANLPNIVTNVRNAVLMYNWKGDVAWFHNPPNKAALDAITGGLLIVGVAAWLARAARRGDPSSWMLVPAIFVMMLPSILSLAFPVENPSHTRMSGTLPGIYLLIALPLGVIVLEVYRLVGRIGLVIGAAGAIGLVGVSYSANALTYFTEYRASYIGSSMPYSVGGEVLRTFAATQGNGYGNAFVLAYPYWWDHRALGISGGSIGWNNTVLRLEDLPSIFRSAMTRPADDPFVLDPNRELLFFLSIDDETGRTWLLDHFPNGYIQTITTYMPRSFDIFIVPAPGYDLMNSILWEGGLEAVSPP